LPQLILRGQGCTEVGQRCELHVSNGKTFAMNANNLSDKNIYVQSVELNGKKIDNPFLSHSAVSAGGASVGNRWWIATMVS
jgi:putative alpha-1,2-mannosidase